MKRILLTTALAVTMVMAAIPPTAQASGDLLGFFTDDALRATGAATAAVSVSNGVLSGSATLTTLGITLAGTLVEEGTGEGGTWQLFKGTATAEGKERSLTLLYNPVDRIAVGNIAKDDQRSLVFYVSPDPAINGWILDGVMASRAGYVSLASYTLTQILEPPSIPGPPTGALPTNLPVELPHVDVGSLTGGTIVPAENGMMGAHHAGKGNHNNDKGQNPKGAQLHHGTLDWYRDVSYPTSFDETPLQSGSFKWLTLFGYSPDIPTYSWMSPMSYHGTVRMQLLIPGSSDGKTSPFWIYGADTYPSHGYSSPVDFSFGIGLGYGPLSAGFSHTVSYRDGDGVSVNVAGDRRSVSAEVDYRTNSPTSKDKAIGMQVGVGATNGQPYFYSFGSNVVISYVRSLCVPGRCVPVYFDVASAPTTLWHGQQIASNWNNWGSPWTPVAQGFDYDYGDRAVTTSFDSNGNPVNRETYYSVPPTGTKTVWMWKKFHTICSAHSITYYYWYWDAGASTWRHFLTSTGSISHPGAGLCWIWHPHTHGLTFSPNTLQAMYYQSMYIDGKFAGGTSFVVGAE